MLSLTDYLTGGMTNLANILLENYRKLNLTHEEFLFYIFLLEADQRGDSFPSLEEISEKMGEDLPTIYRLVEGLIQKKVIALRTLENKDGQKIDSYDLTPIFNEIEKLQIRAKHEAIAQQEVVDIQSLYQHFEQEFRRPLSPIELEQITNWLEEDHYQIELIYLALREAVLNQAYSFKYIDSILLAWERKNIRTKEQVQNEQQRRKESIQNNHQQSSRTTSSSEPKPKIPLFNWLDKDERKD